MKKLLSLILTLAMLCTVYVEFGITASAEAPSGDFITFSSPNRFTIAAQKVWDGRLYYSINGEEYSWTEYDGDTELTAEQIGDTGDYYLCFRGENNSVMSCGDGTPFWTINGSDVACNGSIENLRDYTGTTPMGYSCYSYMFFLCVALIKAPYLPATTLADYCYYSMFSYCEALEAAPSLPATTLTNSCYYLMFSGCTALKTAPSLPATTLAYCCYGNMFSDCTALEAAPSLPAITLTDSCYYFMFSGCTSLETAPSLPATGLADYCYEGMFNGCPGIKLYENASDAGGAPLEWSIPAAANADGLTKWNSNMLFGTGGDFKGAPEVGKTYYIWTPVAKREAHDVAVTYQAGATSGTVYSVEITWGSMEFTYTDASQGTWNPTTLQYEGASTAGWTCATDANKITVKNRSNAAVSAELTFALQAGFTGGFYDAETGGNAIAGSSLALASAAPVGEATTGTEQTGTAYIQITSGTLTDEQTDVKLGTITVEVN